MNRFHTHERPIRPSDVGLGKLFYLIKEAVVVADTETDQILLWNEAAEEMFGYTEYEALSMPLETLVPPQLRDRHLIGIKNFNEQGPGALLRSGKPVELPALRKDGSQILIELSLTTLEQTGSPRSYVMGLVRDVSQRRGESQLFIQLVRALPIGVFMTDGSGQPIFANNEAQRLLGRGILPGTSPDSLADVYQVYRSGTDHLYESERMPLVRALHGDESTVDDMEIRRPDGTSAIEVWGTPILDALGDVKNAVAVFIDISARREAESALRASEERFRQAFDHASIGHALVSLEGRLLKINKRLYELLGYSEEELLTKTVQDVTHPDDLAADAEHKQRLIAGEADSYEFEKRYLHRTGTIIWVQLSVSLVRDDQNQPMHFVAQNQDITESKALRAQLLHEASHDPLTELWNRRRFEEEAERNLQEARRYGLFGALLFIDVDRFKQINDTFGHHAGDEALRWISRILKERFRETDTLGRLGGDEFAALLPRVDLSQAGEIANSFSSLVAEESLTVDGQHIQLSVSTGFALYGPETASVTELLVQADSAMYQAKRAAK